MKIFELYSLGGFFAYLLSKNLFSELVTSDNAEILDLGYFYNHSHDKRVLPTFDNLVSYYGEEEEPSKTALEKLYDIIIAKNLLNWQKIYEAYVTEYNPLNNYDMTEQENVASRIISESNSKSGVYAFNTGDESNPASDLDSSTTTSGNADENERILTRSGNIGVTTSQQMLQSELELRKYKLIDKIYLDIDSVIAYSVYE